MNCNRKEKNCKRFFIEIEIEIPIEIEIGIDPPFPLPVGETVVRGDQGYRS